MIILQIYLPNEIVYCSDPLFFLSFLFLREFLTNPNPANIAATADNNPVELDSLPPVSGKSSLASCCCALLCICESLLLCDSEVLSDVRPVSLSDVDVE